MEFVPRAITRPLSQLGAAAQNALEIARFGGLDTGEEASPYVVEAHSRNHRLRHYFADTADAGPAVLLVPPLMLATDVYDVAPTTSAVGILHENGIDPWVVDFGAPEHETGGLERTLADHVIAVSDAVDQVRAHTGRDVHLGGYSQGGMFCYQAAAFRRSAGIASLVTFGSPVDTRAAMPLGLPDEAADLLAFIAEHLIGRRPIPAWLSRTGFRMLDPAKSLRQRIDFLLQLHNREALLPRESQRRFLENEGWVAWPGPAMVEFMSQFLAHNRMLSGGFTIEDRLVTLADITSPLLCFVGTVDEIAPPAVVRAVARAAPLAEVYETALRAGHFGLVVGSTAATTTWPTVAGWAHWREGEGDRPAAVGEPAADEEAAADPGPGFHVGHGLELAANVGLGALRSTVRAAGQTQRTLRGVSDAAVTQLPRLIRLERSTAHTRISIGLLLDEQARRAGDDIFFLWEDRGYTHAQAKFRIDNVVRGLIDIGVRQGEHVGVLMEMRPSALALVAALSRLGATAVLLRPGPDIATEAQLGEASRIITDPDHAAEVVGMEDVDVLVLGGGGEPRDLGFGLTDMERIDPDAITLPAWYTPNPGRAGDVAFLLFTGAGTELRVNRITNRRWALSAFGTASAARLSSQDTVYNLTPIHHPSSLLTTIGGAAAGGARIALASSFDPETFWEETRRYGVTVVSYTWTLLRSLLDAPASAAEQHHPVRLFIGSGMPSGLWRRTLQRFAPAGVLEFYASTEGEAVLANLSGAKVGAKGRPLPGSAEVRLAAYDAERQGVIEGPDGFAIECGDDEVGMLLSRVDLARSPAGAPLRGLFDRGDAWLATGDLFRRDSDGDYWLVGQAHELIHTLTGPVGPVPIEDALACIDAVDLAVAYGVGDLIVAALTLRAGAKLDAARLTDVAGLLEAPSRPDVIRVVEEIPVTAWHRLRKSSLAAEGIPAGPHWRLDAKRERYELVESAPPPGSAAGDVSDSPRPAAQGALSARS